MRKIIRAAIIRGVGKVPQSTVFCLFLTAGLILLACAAWAGQKVYYEPTIKGIIRNDCGRCHSGPTRNLMDYDTLNSYAQSGLLSGMIQGPMKRFAGNDTQTILDWVNQGAKEKAADPQGQQVKFVTPPAANCPIPPVGARHKTARQGQQQTNQDRISYTNTIQYVLKEDCLRCHSSKFRNLTTYENVKMYVDNGLLKELVRLGGPMHRFAGPDTRLIIQWINEGAPQWSTTPKPFGT